MNSTLKGFQALPLLLCLLASAESLSQENGEMIFTEEDTQTKAYSALDTSDNLGDAYDPVSGSISFSVTDISLKGNFNIPVELRRNFQPGIKALFKTKFKGIVDGLGGWNLDVPVIQGNFVLPTLDMMGRSTGVESGTGYHIRGEGGWYANQECSSDIGSFYATDRNGSYPITPQEYWFGKFLHIPGKESADLVLGSGEFDGMQITSRLYKVTNCYERSDGIGEGFEVTAPDGTRYYFDHAVTFNSGTNSRLLGNAGGTRQIFATRVVDKFGNTVSYNYSGKKLDSITSSDGREIHFAYEGDNLISASANGRVWRYERFSDSSAIEKVVQPDGKAWIYSKNFYKQWLAKTKTRQSITESSGLCESYLDDLSKSELEFSVSTPDGLQINYKVKDIYHGRHNVRPYNWGSPLPIFKQPHCSFRQNLISREVLLNGQNSTEGNKNKWQYDYSENAGLYVAQLYDTHNVTQAIFDDFIQRVNALTTRELEASLPYGKPDSVITARDVKTVTVTEDKIETIFYIERLEGAFSENKILAKDTIDSSSNTLLRREEYYYTQGEQYLSSCKRLSPLNSSNNPQDETKVFQNLGLKDECYISVNEDAENFWVNLSKKIVKLYDSSGIKSVYTTEYSDFNKYGIATKTVEKQGGYSRYITKSFEDDPENEVINLPGATHISSTDSNYKTVSEVKYKVVSATNELADGVTHQYAVKLPEYENSFGVWKKKFSEYHADGNIKKVEYNQGLRDSAGAISSSENRYTLFEQYKRGIPQTITHTKRNEFGEGKTFSQTQIVDDNGWVSSVTDLNQVTTKYGYDAMGRLAYIDRPDSWLDAVYSWSGVDADGNTVTPVTRTELRCKLNADRNGCEGSASFSREQRFDGLLRPTLITETVGGVSRYQVNKWNAYNQNTFKGKWLGSTTKSAGVQTSYDALQRQDKVEEIGTNGVTYGSIDYDYLSGNKIKVTDAENNVTTTTYLAYGSPAYDQAVKIESPENVTTDIDINIFGNINSITQSGKGADNTDVSHTETRRYNAQQQLCLVIRGDVGTTAYQYNNLGEMVLQAQGVTASGTDCGFNYTDASKQKVEFVYDNLGDLWKVNYADTNTPDIKYTRDGNGNITNLTAGTVVQAYNYNSLNLLDDETLTVDGKRIAASATAFSLDYTYDGLGNVKSLTYPDGDVISFAPNAFGQPTKAVGKRAGRTTDFTYASNAVYYPNGSIKSFNYGNDYQHKTTLNTRNVPSDIEDFKGTTHALRYGYLYDNNLNITKLTDGVNSAFSLSSLTYDGLDRLKTTTGDTTGIGSSSISYDGLGNILSYNSKGHTLTYTYNYAKDTSTYSDGYSNQLRQVADGIGNKDYAMFAYDDRGNITNNSYHAFAYNRANQMVKSIDKTYLYDGHNRRVKQTDSKGTSFSLYSLDGTLLYRETDQGGINYIYLGKKLIAKDGVIPEDSGTQHYRPYGESIEGAIDDVGYTGHKFDTDLGLSYMQARYYDPVIGRFYSNDPVGWTPKNPVMSFNRYAYANNNPYKYVDPDGENPQAAARAGWAIGEGINLVAFHLTGVTLSTMLANAVWDIVHNESADDVTDRSGQDGTKNEVDGFVKDLDSVSEPQSDDKNIRVLKPGVKVDDLKNKAPGSDNGRGRNKTQEGGVIGTHESTSTLNSDGSRAKTIDVHRPSGSANKKYRESH
ncbi:RHS repeat domain-containing protein [Bowmanella denitrificans]|uniref:RHS repeat domain-containing protein n=1 Tax=Bowmanella denitrificans TaxID=366582 RepID=UPI000C9D1DEE|nr:RHS repeat-associated core domain-containing protein [Bowmanella denitrificans]